MSRLVSPSKYQLIALGVLLTGAGAMFSPPLRVVAQPPDTPSGTMSAAQATGVPQPLATPEDDSANQRVTRAIGPITGQGTTDNIAKFTGANAIGNSIMVEKSGKIGIGTTVPPSLLSVVGTSASTYSVYASNPGTGAALYGIGTGGIGVYGSHSANTDPPGVSGDTSSTSASAVGVLGTIKSTAPGASSAGVRGINKGTGVAGYGVYGSHAGGGSGVYGVSVSGNGVLGSSTSGIGVRGSYTGTSGTIPGILGETNSTTPLAIGLEGIVNPTNPGASSAGVRGINNGTGTLGIGVYGSHAGGGYGVYGFAPSGYGVVGASNTGYGLYGSSSNGYGAYASSSSSYGVYGTSSTNYGVYGTSSSNNGVYGSSSSKNGVVGLSLSNNGAGVQGTGYIGVQGNTSGTSTGSQGIRGDNGGSNTNGYAGYFNGRVTVAGNLNVTGTLTKSAGTFRIDNPLHPATEYLSHSFVESPDMMNVYNGNAILNKKGEAVVTMPDYFQALNSDFRYQLTCIGAPALLYVAQEISHNHFKIAGGKPGMKVSWQVTGIRQDAYARQHRVKVEEAKTGDDRGKYLYPAGFGASNDKLIGPAAPRFAAR